MSRSLGKVVCLLGVAGGLTATSAYAESGDTTDALPGIVRVPVASTSARGLAVGAGAGYGYTEGVLGKGDSYSRASGSLAVSYQPTSYFAAALRFDGRYDVDTGAQTASGGAGDPRLELRFAAPVGSSLRLGGQVGVWCPGGKAPSFDPSAITPDLSLLASYARPQSPLTVTSRVGFRWDNSSNSVSNASQISLPDRVELGISQASAVLTGLGVGVRLSPHVELLGDVTWDLLVGSAAPSVVDAPILASIGARYAVDTDGKLQIMAALTASPSGRPTVIPSAPLVDIEPRVSAFIGLVLRPFAKRTEPDASVVAPPRSLLPPPAPLPSAHGRLTGRALAEDGRTPLVHAHVLLTPKSGAGPQSLDTDDNGRFESRDLDFGEVSVSISAPGFKPTQRTVTISGAPAQLEIIATRALPPGEVRGVIRDFAGKPIVATVQIIPGDVQVKVGPDGTFYGDVQPGTYDVIIHAPGYVEQKRHVNVERNAVILLDVELRQQTR